MQPAPVSCRTPGLRNHSIPPFASPRSEAVSWCKPALCIIPPGRVLFWQGDLQPEQIEIVQGVVRAVRLHENGTRQILAFYWPGDTVRASRSACQQYTAEAVTRCRVTRTKISEACSLRQPCGAHQVLSETLSLVQTMAKKNSIARLAWFLLRIRPHLPADPARPHALQVLLPRADIADHLGTSMENVCRTLADFRSKRLIDLPSRKTIRFLNLAGLAHLAGD